MSKQHEQHDPAAGTQAAKSSSTSPAPRECEWIRPKEVMARFGIGRSRLYALIAEGKIDSVSLCSAGEKQGTRLVKYASVTAYLEALLATAKTEGGAA